MRKKKDKNLENILIEKIGYGGVGLGKLENGKKVMVKGGALPGSVVDLRITRSKKDFVQGHITNIHKLNSEFTDGEVFCPHYFNIVETVKCKSEDDSKKTPSCKGESPKGSGSQPQNNPKIGCGGCKRQVMSYAKQLELKEKIVLENFEKIIADQGTEFFPILGSDLEKNYRNKIEFSFGKFITGRGDDKQVLSNRSLGFHKQGEFSKIVDIDSCGLISDKANKIFEYLKKLLQESGLPVRDSKTGEGFFRHLVIREGINTDQILVNLSVADRYFEQTGLQSKRENFKNELSNDDFLQKTISSFVITTNNGLADTVKGPDIQVESLRGDGYIFEKLYLRKESSGANLKDPEDLLKDSSLNSEGLDKSSNEATTFRVSPFSFFQTNTLGAQKLFSRAAELVGKNKGNILDLYCGTGTIGLSFLKMGLGQDLIGIEIVEDAIIDARKNAEINGLENHSFFVAGPAEKIVVEHQEVKSRLENIGLVIIDPPREGLHKTVIDFLLNLQKEHKFKLLYISCNPVTMSRDVDLFVHGGMKLHKLQAVDMFPQTHHIECIGILS